MTLLLKRTAALILLALMVTSGIPAGAGPAGGVLRIGIDVDAGTLDPRLANDTTARRVIEQVYDGLVELDAQLVPRPDGAVGRGFGAVRPAYAIHL